MKGTRLLRSNRNLKVLLLGLVALGATAIGIAIYATGVLNSPEGDTIDARFSIRGTQHPPKNFVIVAVDNKTLQDLNSFPFPRAYYAQLISNIAAEHPRAIVFDIELADKTTIGKTCKVQGTTYPCDDLALLEAISNYPGLTVFDTTAPAANGSGQIRFLGSGQGTTLLEQLGSRPGAALFPTNQPGGVYRQMVYSVQNVPTLYVVAAELAGHKKITKKEFGGTRWIDYPGAQHTIPWISFSSVYDPKKYGPPTGWNQPLPSNYFRGKVVFVGATQLSLLDYHATSTDAQMAGAEIEADAAATVLQGFPLGSAPGWINIGLIVLFGVGIPLLTLRVRPLVAFGVAVAVGVAFAILAQLLFDSGTIVSVVYPLTALALSAVGSLAVGLVTEAFERIRAVDLFARFVPENVVDQVLASADGLRLGGVQRDGTIMFTDLRGFTSFSEKLKPAQVIDVLNHYLSEMSDAILDNGGTLVAYMGDGIFAVFGAPLEQPDHADRALRTAREMLEVRLPRFNQWIRDQGLGDGFRMGIGLNSGYVMSGHVGSERRVEYAAVGDTTNTASRIEALTKGTPHQLLLSDSTRDALLEPADDLVFVDEVEIRGRVARMKLWGLDETAPSEAPKPEAAAQLPA
ncbi:MAG TPA: adenylate/guanylate cyclase domain-containing protein [Solirubrobacteraceae bacterium]|nr:adenylate/guanylate cyclase domain-containing protein [Solirubrobacteraceae bacterium]